MKNEIPAERKVRIMEKLRENGIVRVDELSAILNVSVITIRRDLTTLEAEGLLERTHGGAISTNLQIKEPTYSDKDRMNVPLKTSIAGKAVSLISEGETVFINSGSTTSLIFRSLASVPGLTIITNNVGALAGLELRPDCELIVTGGTFRHGTSCLVGEEVLSRLEKVHPTTSILGVDGISFKKGLTSHNTHEAAVSRKMMDQTRGKIIVVADSSKLGALSQHYIGDLSEIDILVTNKLPDPSFIKDFEGIGIKLIVSG